MKAAKTVKKLKKVAKKIAKAEKAIPKALKGKGGYSQLRNKVRNQGKLKGSGDYVDDVISGGGKIVGDAIRAVGSKALGWLSNGAKSLIGSLLGSGDYMASGHPVANTMSTTTTAMPAVESTRGRGNIIRNTEMIAPVYASDVLRTDEYHISPGLVDTFPWLHPTGDMYQEWRMNGGVVTFVPTVAPLDDAAGGDCVINMEYDLDAPMPTTIQEVTGSYLAVAGRPLDRMVMAIECAPHETPYTVFLTRTTELLSTPHYPYDLGKLRVTTANQPTATAGKLLGRLYITYEMEFFKPMVRSIPMTIPMWAWQSGAFTVGSAAPFFTVKADFDGGTTAKSTIKPEWISATEIALPSSIRSGKWLFILQNSGSGAGVANVQGSISLSGATGVYQWLTGASTLSSLFSSVTGTVNQVGTIILSSFEVTAPAPTITFSGWTYDSGYQTMYLLPQDADILGWNRAMRANRDYFDCETKKSVELSRRVRTLVDEEMDRRNRVQPPLQLQVEEKHFEDNTDASAVGSWLSKCRQLESKWHERLDRGRDTLAETAKALAAIGLLDGRDTASMRVSRATAVLFKSCEDEQSALNISHKAAELMQEADVFPVCAVVQRRLSDLEAFRTKADHVWRTLENDNRKLRRIEKQAERELRSVSEASGELIEAM